MPVVTLLQLNLKPRLTLKDNIMREGLPCGSHVDHIFEENKIFCCTICYEDVVGVEIRKHPLLDVNVCSNCRARLEEILENSVSSNFCVWCGRSINLISCNFCSKLFCTICITKNFGDQLSEAKVREWMCCCCSPVLLQKHELDQKFACLYDMEWGHCTVEELDVKRSESVLLKLIQEVSHGDATEGWIVNGGNWEESTGLVRIPRSLSSKLKPHQIEGIRFMWQNAIISLQKAKSGDRGLGCILAHTMGLGKTFQVIAFLYVVMRVADIGLKTALLVTPVNVLHNWRREFEKWRPSEYEPLRILLLEDVARDLRGHMLAKWNSDGGILLIGYSSFRNLSFGRNLKDKREATEIINALQYGPDILICDEAHMIKNTKADITQALKLVKTKRRIALTGSPLQNNLMEYYCMVDFAREGILGTSKEFRHRFKIPIESGQHKNSTKGDVIIMNQRLYILYKVLEPFVQRKDMNIVKNDLPSKTVFVIAVKLSTLQKELYKRYLYVHGHTRDMVSSNQSFFSGYQTLSQIWTHPGLFELARKNRYQQKREDAVENFVVDEYLCNDYVEYNVPTNAEKQQGQATATEWWEDLLQRKIYKEVDCSGKMVLLLEILSMSCEVGDKALVFSQSLTTLDLIEKFLSKVPRKEKEGRFWKAGKDWYRLDGSTDGLSRQKLIESFNEPSNSRVKCALISTRAGSFGINLYAANRVILVDISWNPTHDLQAIYRVWRYGQKKPVYAYRLLAHRTMEEKIYKRQISKEGLAARVVDRQQILRTMSKEEMMHLFDYSDDESCEEVENDVGSSASSSDEILEKLLSRHHPCWIAKYHEHESNLQENEVDRLPKDEEEFAWTLYNRWFSERKELDD